MQHAIAPAQIKCNNEQPICSNCKIYDKACVYVPLNQPGDGRRDGADAAGSTASPSAHPSTPSRRKTARVAVPFSRKTPATSASHGRPTTGSAYNDGIGARDFAAVENDPSRAGGSSLAQGQLPRHGAGDSRIVVSSNGTSSYHGHTSTLYEEQGPPEGDGRPRIPDEWIGKGLVAEAARQRQLEELNFHTGKLDFDGVDPDLGMHLLNLHWNRQHHSFNITYRPAFMRDMASDGPYFSKLLLNALYFGASKFSPRFEVRKDPADVRTAGWKYRERVRKLLGSALDQSDITTIQALLVMSNSLFALGDERSAAWLYAGLAFRMIIDLGMHVDVEGKASARRFTHEDLEIRRRVFWAAFIVDKIQSLYQGRPVTLKESDTLMPIKFLDTYEEFEYWRPMAFSLQSTEYQGTPAYSVSTFTALCRLSVVMSDILSDVYAERTFDKMPSELSALLENLDNKLKAWKSSLPDHLTMDSKNVLKAKPPHVFSLNAMYHVLCILLHRPFVADGHLYGNLRDISVKSLITCASAADHIVTLLRAYDHAFAVARAPYLISYACYVAATIHVRIAAKRRADSEAHSNLATCLAVFNRNQETNRAIQRAQHIIQGLMKRLGVPEPRPDFISAWSGREELAARGTSEPILQATSNAAGGRSEQGGACEQDASVTQPPEPRLSPRSDFADGALESSDSPARGWSDIDGIIQSFVRAPETTSQQGIDLTYELPGSAEGGPNSMGQPRAQRFTYKNTLRSQQNTFPQPEYGLATSDRDMPWPQGMADGSVSIDDLLFGLNSAALDSFQF
ncbi:fungal specific transcription factor domain-containing protein [Cordyceps fumosorosea ARSEF 2679]|uniref:Fungal specific transcription factor domain-containing protein n=1 Tax=Cordyceps fumosorosea (strain ARSEF 2679) TaxID=1081104 RepID=A0A167S8N3_CORFA|nr:fungal specific transcription factor domain-containing protein [Cordyceps fumosorosea ARSEF 2679]OAA59370.1 fungal specific transcription factor domain-containing protein [Cordyceps fumosorosea ARSEF 2679]